MTDFNTLLMWANQDPKYPNSFIIKTDNQKLLGLIRTDKNGTTYWKFKERSKKKVIKEANLETSPVVDNIQKFQQRQNQANNYDNQSDNSVQNNSSQ